MDKFIQFCKDSWHEITKEVTWPTWASLQSNATLVLIASIIFALVVGGIDFLITKSLQFLYETL